MIKNFIVSNPIDDGWYADPESRVYGDTVYMYVTRSLPFEEQLNLDVVYTKDFRVKLSLQEIAKNMCKA